MQCRPCNKLAITRLITSSTNSQRSKQQTNKYTNNKKEKYKQTNKQRDIKTLPKALRTQALTALTSNFGLVGLVRWVWLGRFDLVGLVW